MTGLAHPCVLADHRELTRFRQLFLKSRVVFTNGVYDLLHPGHVNLLQRAKDFGDLLVVGLNDDLSAARLGKGPGRPFNSYAARAFVLAHLDSVDLVVPFSEDTPIRVIEFLKPDVLVKGGDWPEDRIVGREMVLAKGGVVKSLPLLADFSSTTLATRIGEAFCGSSVE